MHDKASQMEENFERNIQENIDQKLEQKFGWKIEKNLDKTIQEKLGMTIQKKHCETLKKINKKIENLEKQVSKEEEKITPMPSQTIIKPSTFGGETSWQVHKTQFMMVAEANGWISSAKPFHLAASLRRDAADILQMLSEAQRHNFDSLSSAFELRFGGKCTKEYSHLQ